jgi:hypothetical protein
MDQTLHDRAPGRHAAGDESGNDSPVAEVDIATICAWCPGIHILKLQRRESDVIIVFQQGKRIAISRNGIPLRVSSGMCERCRAEKFPETLPRKEGSPCSSR